jgi:hypothetical protein
MGGSNFLRGALFLLVFAMVVLLFLPKDCAKQVPGAVAKLRQREPSGSKGLHIETTTPEPSSGAKKAVEYPSGLDAARLQYLIELDPHYSTPKTATLLKHPGGLEASTVVAALLSLRYIERQPDGSYAFTRDGLMKVNATDQGDSWLIPLAKRQLVRVDAIDCSAPDQCKMTFVWQWQPNDVGSAIQANPEPHSGTARVQGGAGRWAVSDVAVDDTW